jgi:RNA polymerase sigma-70 factor (ECF subfamily)
VAVDTEQLYRRYGPMVLRRCRRLLGTEERAMEATQDVFVQVLRRQDRLDVENPSALLYRMATNISLNHIRSRKRRPETPDGELIQRIAEAPVAEERAGAMLMLERLFGREKESTRTIAVMHLLDGMTHEEVADAVGLSVSGVRKRLRVLRAHLHELQEVA